VRRIHFTVEFSIPMKRIAAAIWEKDLASRSARNSALDLDFVAAALN